LRKIKNLKKLTLRRKGYVLVGDEFVLPVHTRGDIALQQAMTEYEKSNSSNLPKLKTRMANTEEISELKKMGYPIGVGGMIAIKEFDRTSPQWLEFMKQRNIIETFMDIAIHIDFEYEIDGQPMWFSRRRNLASRIYCTSRTLLE